MYSGQSIDDDFEDVDKLSGSALRNMTQDVEKLAQHIHGTDSKTVFDLFENDDQLFEKTYRDLTV